MPGANHLDLVFRPKDIQQRLGQRPDGAGRGLLDEGVPRIAVGEGKQDQINRFGKGHQKPGHHRVGHGQGLPGLDLADKVGNHAAPAGHHVAVTGGAKHRAACRDVAAFGDHHLFHHRLADPHGVERGHRLVGGKADHPVHLGGNGGGQHVVGADHVGLDRFHGVKLTRRDLL